VLGLLYPRRLQKTYHAAGGGCRNRACQVRSWSFEEAGLDWTQVEDWTVCTYVCICGWVSRWIRRLLVVAGEPGVLQQSPWLLLSNVELQATTEPHCSRSVQPGGICAYVAYIASRLPEVRGRACAGAASASYASCRSDSIYSRKRLTSQDELHCELHPYWRRAVCCSPVIRGRERGEGEGGGA
jgi:hypothetical protein